VKTAIASIESIRKTHEIDEVGIKAQLKNEVALAETEKKALDKEMKSHVQFVSDAVDELDRIKKARGTTNGSIANGIEAILKIFGASKESYHLGDYNDGYIHLIVRYAKEIGELILTLLLERSTIGGASE
jgi:hypothetical protein